MSNIIFQGKFDVQNFNIHFWVMAVKLHLSVTLISEYPNGHM